MGAKFWYKETKGKAGRTVLSKEHKELFQAKSIVCIEYDDLNDKQQRDIFQVFSIAWQLSSLPNAQSQKVQMGVPLSPAGA